MVDLAEEFRAKFETLLEKYKAAERIGPEAIENMASACDADVAALYALKSSANPEMFAKFKDFAEMRLAWNVGQPPAAVENFSRHKNLGQWIESGSEMVLNLYTEDTPPRKCSAELREQIKKDFTKMTGCEFKDDYFFDGDAPYIKIPSPESTVLKGRLIGRTIAENGLSGKPLPPSLIKKVGTDPIFKAWDDYQKKLLKAADSPEAMLAAFSEMSLLLPLNYLNEVLSGLSSYLKEWADSEPTADPRKTPRSPGGPTPPGGDGHDPSSDPDSHPDVKPGTKGTYGGLVATTMPFVCKQLYDDQLTLELATMDDPKSKALLALIDEWKTRESNLALRKDPMDEALTLKLREHATKQLEEMTPFIVKHARDRGNLRIDAAMQQVASKDTIAGINTMVENIGKGLTPNGNIPTGQTAPDFTQLFDLLEGDKADPKRRSFNQTYKGLDLSVQNNALLRAVKKIMDTPRLTKEQRNQQFKDLMHGDTVWTPQDIAAADTLIQALRDDNHIKEPADRSLKDVPSRVPIKPYGQKARGHEMDVMHVAQENMKNMENELAAFETEGTIPGNMKFHQDLNLNMTEIIDEVSGSITLRVQEKDQKPWYVTYCDAQKKIVLMDRDNNIKPLDFDAASPELKGTCTKLADHYSIIMDNRTPFKKDKHLSSVFTELLSGGRIRAPHEIDRGRP